MAWSDVPTPSYLDIGTVDAFVERMRQAIVGAEASYEQKYEAFSSLHEINAGTWGLQITEPGLQAATYQYLATAFGASSDLNLEMVKDGHFGAHLRQDLQTLRGEQWPAPNPAKVSNHGPEVVAKGVRPIEEYRAARISAADFDHFASTLLDRFGSNGNLNRQFSLQDMGDIQGWMSLARLTKVAHPEHRDKFKELDVRLARSLIPHAAVPSKLRAHVLYGQLGQDLQNEAEAGKIDVIRTRRGQPLDPFADASLWSASDRNKPPWLLGRPLPSQEPSPFSAPVDQHMRGALPGRQPTHASAPTAPSSRPVDDSTSLFKDLVNFLRRIIARRPRGEAGIAPFYGNHVGIAQQYSPPSVIAPDTPANFWPTAPVNQQPAGQPNGPGLDIAQPRQWAPQPTFSSDAAALRSAAYSSQEHFGSSGADPSDGRSPSRPSRMPWSVPRPKSRGQ
ncbi:hypothetical protein ACLQ25_28485 [Micromonospora sp. DT44]|uniref:hypothetical protein n=1 Tax=Micromonospora sp. DT44 TaxID=3393439 RepID=UPI003CF771DA